MKAHCVYTELSDRDWNCITLRPGRLLCLKCLNGGGTMPFMSEEYLQEKLSIIKSNSQIHIRLETSFDEMGAKTTKFYTQNVAERKRDLDVLQILGLSPGDMRIARDLYELIGERIENVHTICGYDGNNTDKWPACPLAYEDYFSQGSKGFNALKSREKMNYWKEISCDDISQANKIVIRSHHLLCIFCYIAGGDSEGQYIPLAEDNLYEVWVKMRDNPDIPVTVIEGPGGCAVCPPCHGFDNERGLCFVACHLRDRKKDADTLQKLDLLPGETLPAKELVKIIYERIPDNMDICAYEYESAPQWKSCAGHERYKIGLEKGFFMTSQ